MIFLSCSYIQGHKWHGLFFLKQSLHFINFRVDVLFILHILYSAKFLFTLVFYPRQRCCLFMLLFKILCKVQLKTEYFFCFWFEKFNSAKSKMQCMFMPCIPVCCCIVWARYNEKCHCLVFLRFECIVNALENGATLKVNVCLLLV